LLDLSLSYFYSTLLERHHTIRRRCFSKQLPSELRVTRTIQVRPRGPNVESVRGSCARFTEMPSPGKPCSPHLHPSSDSTNHAPCDPRLSPTKFHLPPKVLFSRQNFVFASCFHFWTSLSLAPPPIYVHFCFVGRTSCNDEQYAHFTHTSRFRSNACNHDAGRKVASGRTPQLEHTGSDRGDPGSLGKPSGSRWTETCIFHVPGRRGTYALFMT
jgi:hypothetical protein